MSWHSPHPALKKMEVHSFEAEEALSELYSIRVELVTHIENAASVVPQDLLGSTGAVGMKHAEGTRFWHGMVTQFEAVLETPTTAHFRATLSPWLWLLTQTSDCRVFQEKSAYDAVTDVFKEIRDGAFGGAWDMEERAERTYTPRDYIVQYNETDFDFASRLMEEEGLYYFFTHTATGHKLVLCDARSRDPQGTLRDRLSFRRRRGTRRPRRPIARVA